MNSPRKAILVASSALFLFGSGYACPPDHIDTNVDESGEGKEADNAWDEFLDRSGKCIELKGDDCDGYPGRGKVGRKKGERFPNFMALGCDDDGEPFEFASLFTLKKDKTPKYKAYLIFTGHDK